MKTSRVLIACAVGLMSLTAARSPAAPGYSVAGLSTLKAMTRQSSIGSCSGPDYGARVQQCIQTRCVPGQGSVAECASSCQAQVRAECGG